MTTLQETFQCDRPVVLVTGSGAPRVGQAIVHHFAQHGCDVVLHANESVDQANDCADEVRSRHSVRSYVTKGSLDNAETAEAIVTSAIDAMGRLDILVNSAAIWSPTSLEDVTADEMRRYFDVNSLGTFFCARAAGIHMTTRPTGGAVVNMGDWATVRPYLDHAAYFPSKGAIEVMTRSLAVELGRRNPRVRVNCVQPGPVLLADDVTEDVRQTLRDSTLTNRVGTPEDVAHAVRMLCENTFITGVCLAVDGGRSIFAPDGLQTGYNTG